MKNYIFLNYNISVDEIYLKDNKKYFFVNNNKIYIVEFKGKESDLDYLAKLSNEMYNNGLLVNTFILNNENKYYTKKDDEYIILLKVNTIENFLDLDYLKKFQFIKNDLISVNILEEWENEVDTLELELIEYNKEYSLIQNSINYFIGMAENAIELLSQYKADIIKNNNSIGHKVNFNLFNEKVLEDPFTFIKVNRMYDMSNYIKYKFITNKLNYDEIDNIFNNCTEYESVYLFSSLLYPNVYFDLVKEILNQNEEESKLKIIINKIDTYKSLLYYCQNLIKNVKDVKLITWLSE